MGSMDNPPETFADPEQQALRERLAALFTSQRFGVLATHRDGQPYSSLVAFAATPDLKRLVFATDRSTRKFDNLTADPRASMLIDNRSNREADFREAMAATAVGRVEEVPDSEKTGVRGLYLTRHPLLRDFTEAPACALLWLEVDSYVVVERFQHVLHWRPPR